MRASPRCSDPKPREFMADYKFHIEPATDDRPYFFNFFKWRCLPELWTCASAAAPAWSSGATWCCSPRWCRPLLAGALLILLPLLAAPRDLAARDRWDDGQLFLSAGAGFPVR